MLCTSCDPIRANEVLSDKPTMPDNAPQLLPNKRRNGDAPPPSCPPPPLIFQPLSDPTSCYSRTLTPATRQLNTREAIKTNKYQDFHCANSNHHYGSEMLRLSKFAGPTFALAPRLATSAKIVLMGSGFLFTQEMERAVIIQVLFTCYEPASSAHCPTILSRIM